MQKIALITGSSGFIGFHLSFLLLSNGWKVIGLDSMSNYYDVELKKARLNQLTESSHFYNYEGSVEDAALLNDIFLRHEPTIMIHLAAQAGVRYSINHPYSYVKSNLIGTFQILEMGKKSLDALVPNNRVYLGQQKQIMKAISSLKKFS